MEEEEKLERLCAHPVRMFYGKMVPSYSPSWRLKLAILRMRGEGGLHIAPTKRFASVAEFPDSVNHAGADE